MYTFYNRSRIQSNFREVTAENVKRLEIVIFVTTPKERKLLCWRNSQRVVSVLFSAVVFVRFPLLRVENLSREYRKMFIISSLSQIPFVAGKLGANRNGTIVGYGVSTHEKKYILSVVRPNAVSPFPSNTKTKIVFFNG